MTKNSFILALATLIGTIIGAGVFGIPFVIAQSGVIPGVLYLLVLGVVATFMYLFLGEVVLRTNTKMRLIGYARTYLGKWAAILVSFSTIAGVVGALLAYIIIGGDFLRLVIPSSIVESDLALNFVFWAVLSLFIFRGIQLIAKIELFMTLALFASILVIFAFAAPHIQLDNYSAIHLPAAFIPFGVILFAFGGWIVVPEIADLFRNKKERRNLDNLIVIALSVVGVFYLLFSLVVIGVSGSTTSSDALSGLAPFLGGKIMFIGGLFGLIAVAASFLVLGNYLKNSLRYDYKVPSTLAAVIAVAIPLVLFLLGFREFISVIGIVGIVTGVIEGIIIVLLYRAAKEKGQRKPEYSLSIPKIVAPAVIAVLVVGTLIELLF